MSRKGQSSDFYDILIATAQLFDETFTVDTSQVNAVAYPGIFEHWAKAV